jgi:hypothetical protein
VEVVLGSVKITGDLGDASLGVSLHERCPAEQKHEQQSIGSQFVFSFLSSTRVRLPLT